MTGNDSIQISRRRGVLRLSLDSPDTRNSLPLAALTEIAAAASTPRPEDRCVLIESAHPGLFCSGFHLGDDAPQAIRSGEAARAAEKAFDALSGCPLPVLAAIDGPAYGAGCELALRCDLRIASERARFSIPAAKLGLPYGDDSIAFLRDRYGPSAAAFLLFTSLPLNATAAGRNGFVQEVVPTEALAARLDEVVRQVVAAPPAVTKHIKSALSSEKTARGETAAARAAVEASADYAEALTAIAERRPARFSD